MSSSKKASIPSPTPYQLHALVLDYLCHGCYTQTAIAFNKDNPVRHLDAAGDDVVVDSDSGADILPSATHNEHLLTQVKLRQQIRIHILSGHVSQAINLLNTHFPSVLQDDSSPSSHNSTEHRDTTSNLEYVSSTSNEPAHLLLNLRILAFCEECRTIPLPYPPAAKNSHIEVDDDPDAMVLEETPPATNEREADTDERSMSLLMAAQKLYQLSSNLLDASHRATYLKELERVGGLLAYKVPETSAVARYLTMERREAVADQINRAILKKTGRPLVSALELITRYTSVVWGAAHEIGVKSCPGDPTPPRQATCLRTQKRARQYHPSIFNVF